RRREIRDRLRRAHRDTHAADWLSDWRRPGERRRSPYRPCRWPRRTPGNGRNRPRHAESRVECSGTHDIRGHQRQLPDRVSEDRATDDLGRYRIIGVPPGEYLVSATVGQVVVGVPSTDLPGYGTTYFPGTAVPAEGQRVNVSASQEVAGVDFALARLKTARVA